MLPLELAEAGAVEAAAARVVSRWRAIDVWINKARVSGLAPVVMGALVLTIVVVVARGVLAALG